MLRIENISFGYGKQPLLKQLKFEVHSGELMAIIGESGSGKTTLLKLIYGDFDLNEGHIFWEKTEILGPKFNLVIGYDFMKHVSQEFDLMPYTTVEENIGKFLSNFYPEEKLERIRELIMVVELKDFAKTKVQFLSGGQKQRVALAQAMAKQPEVLLLDEPFSHIDNFKKQSLRRNLFNYLKQNNITCLVATHDKDDILGFADKLIVLNNGEIIANDTPEQLYENPKTALVAAFFEEFNVFKKSEIDDSNDSKTEVIVYAHQLKITETSDIKVTVLQSYFNGKNYLVTAKFLTRQVIFYSDSELESNEILFLKVSR